MVSSVCRETCSTNVQSKAPKRALLIDSKKDYSKPLQVETSVEYDLPAHIYPPKGAQPILMIHPAYTTPVRARRVPVTPGSQLVSSPGSSKPLSDFNVKSGSKVGHSRAMCSCGIVNCNISSGSRSLRQSSASHKQPQSVLNKKILNIPENIYSAVKNNTQSMESHSQQKQLQQQKAKLKQLQQLQQQQNQMQIQVQYQLQERSKLQARQLEQLQQQQKSRQQNNDLLAWGVGGRCQGPCCQPRIGALPPTQAEFLAPGLPPSLVRTPTRGSAVGSPKLRARTRRGISVASTVNLPEYLGSSRSSRTNSLAALGISSHTHNRSRSSMLAATPAPITAHQVASALDVVRAHVLTPRSLFASQQQQTLPTDLSSGSSLLSTVGQSRDSGCSLGAEFSAASASNFSCDNPSSAGNVEWTWGVVDSGFSTPVDSIDDSVQPMEVYESNPSTLAKNYTSVSSMVPLCSTLSSTKEGNSISSGNSKSSLQWIREVTTPSFNINSASARLFNPIVPSVPMTTTSLSSSSSTSTNTNLYWMKDLTAPLGSNSSSVNSSFHNSFLPPSAQHYFPQTMWNLAY